MGYGWNVTRVGDANDLDAARRAPSTRFKASEDRPTLIIVDSHIGYGSPHKQDTAAAHGEPLGEEEVRETKRAYGWPEDAQFLVPDGVREHFAEGIGTRGARAARRLGAAARSATRASTRARRAQIERDAAARAARGLGRATSPRFAADAKGIATRKASNKVQNAIAAQRALAARRLGRPHRLDLGPARLRRRRRLRARATAAAASSTSGSASTSRRRSPTASRSRSCGRSWSTYLTFSDYARPAIRLSALMELPVIHVFTHDSIGLGEDGPTHQPVEQLASLRAIPGLDVIRPCDANEVAEAWRVAIDRTTTSRSRSS